VLTYTYSISLFLKVSILVNLYAVKKGNESSKIPNQKSTLGATAKQLTAHALHNLDN